MKEGKKSIRGEGGREREGGIHAEKEGWRKGERASNRPCYRPNRWHP